MNNKVLITGLNMITSLGLNAGDSWKKLCAGSSGAGPIRSFNTTGLDTQFAAQLPEGFDAYAERFIKKRIAHQMSRVTRMCYVCALEAIESHGIQFDALDRTRCAVITGAVNAGNSSIETGTEAGNRIVKNMSNAMPAWISMHYKLEGPSFTVNTACASSAFAIGIAFDLVRSGRADLVIAAGADSTINPEDIGGFNHLYALFTKNERPEQASCPFSNDRDGFVIGEGAGALILESEASACRRNATVYAELAGVALTSEAYNIMAPAKNGEGMAKTMAGALADAGMSANEIQYINAHGTATTLNDWYETMAIKKVFGEHAYRIPVSAPKSMIGHTIGAAGAIEAAITALTIQQGIITPTINFSNSDPDLDLDYVPNTARRQAVKAALSNSFAFGGHNATLALKHYS